MPKTKAQKQELLSTYEAYVEKSNFVIVETARVPANVLTSLRKKISEVGGHFSVIKNNVFQKAAQKEESLAETIFEGSLAVLEGGEDVVTALKAFESATKDAKAALLLSGEDEQEVAKYAPFTFKFGVIDHRLLSADDTVRLSTLPDKNTILAQFVGTLAAPISGMLNVMNGVSRNLVYALTDLKEKKAQTAS